MRGRILHRAALSMGFVAVINLVVGAHEASAPNLLTGMICLIGSLLTAGRAHVDTTSEHKKEQ